MDGRTGKRKAQKVTPRAGYPSFPGRLRWHLLAFLLLITATLLLYAGSLNLGFFHLDDPSYVTKNPWIRGLTGSNLIQVLTKPYFANYSPLHILSYLVDHAVAGMNPWAFHLSSILWAGVVAGFVYLLAVGMTGKRAIGLAAGILFVAHPVHVEAVVWISSRKDLVATAFALPSMLMYLQHRKAGRYKWHWYAAALACFCLAVAGKLSVVVLPAILLASDYLIERRRGLRPVLEKIPFGLIVLVFGLVVMGVQPPTRQPIGIQKLGYVMTQSAWLLTGFGDYVIYRVTPEAIGGVRLLHLLLLAAALAVPLMLHRRIPGLVLVLYYWMILSLIPSQILSFIHPVTDRYLYFPSVGLVVLVAWAIFMTGRRLGPKGIPVAICLVAALAALWSYRTLAYLGEWSDPRSVWFGAAAKSEDTNVYQFLGTHYQTAADSLAQSLAAGGSQRREAYALARAEWESDPRLEKLMAEWDSEEFGGPATLLYQRALRDRAWDEFGRAIAVKGKRVRPNLFFRRAKLQFDLGNLDAAAEEFRRAYEESRQHTFVEVRREMAVRCHHALGIIEWQRGNHAEALRMLTIARDEQLRAGMTWIPNLDGYIRRLESEAGSNGSE
jgi:hypothetical protein